MSQSKAEFDRNLTDLSIQKAQKESQIIPKRPSKKQHQDRCVIALQSRFWFDFGFSN